MTRTRSVSVACIWEGTDSDVAIIVLATRSAGPVLGLAWLGLGIRLPDPAGIDHIGRPPQQVHTSSGATMSVLSWLLVIILVLSETREAFFTSTTKYVHACMWGVRKE